jgi:hypothetical protein
MPDAERVPMNMLAQMRRDPMLAFGLLFIKSYIARAPWHIKSSDPRRAAFIDQALRRVYGRFVLQYLGCLEWGFAPLVKNFERSGDPRSWTFIDGDQELPVWTATADALIWKPFTALNPRKATARFDASGSFSGIDYGPSGNAARFPFESGGKTPSVPLDWALWATNEKDSVHGSLYGFSRLAYAYRPWHSFWYRWALADRAFERWADPPVVAYHPTDMAVDPETGETRNYTLEALGLAERLRSGANVSLPSDTTTSLDGDRVTNARKWSLEQLKSEVDFSSFNESFEYLDVAKLRAVMVPEQALLEGKGGTSSRNVASTLGDVFEESQAVILSEMHWLLNRNVIPQLLEANFGQYGASCEIVSDGFNANDVETARTLLQALTQNAPEKLAAVDARSLLERLNVPTKSPALMEAETLQAAEAVANEGPCDREADEFGVEVKDGKYRRGLLDRAWSSWKVGKS